MQRPGTPGEQTIIITESSAEPYVNFYATNQSVSEGNRLVDVIVQLSNAWSSDVAIQFSISGSALGGAELDYELSGTSLDNFRWIFSRDIPGSDQ